MFLGIQISDKADLLESQNRCSAIFFIELLAIILLRFDSNDRTIVLELRLTHAFDSLVLDRTRHHHVLHTGVLVVISQLLGALCDLAGQ